MARLNSIGFELASITTDVELSLTSGTPTVDSANERSGTNSILINPAGAAKNFRYYFAGSNQTDGFFFRYYIYINSYPLSDTANTFTLLSTGNSALFTLRMNTAGVLQMWNADDSANIGDPSSELSLNTWYRVEMKVDTTTISTTACEGLVDGTSFGSGTINLSAGIARAIVGAFDSQTYSMYVDDFAINNDSGSFQNSWPGEGEIIHLRPSAAGDADDWDLTTTYEDIDEVTPDDATTLISATITDQIHDVNIDATPAALASGDTVNCVQVGVRFNLSAVSGTDPTFVLRIKSDTGATVEESANITASTATWNTNAVAAPRNYNLTLYDLPGASTTAWTKATLDTAQIGVRQTNTVSDIAQVSTLWLLVDHKPGEAPPAGDAAVGYRNLLGVGI